jgi:septal ring factor EnvC (AmiA/AmiB activator)
VVEGGEYLLCAKPGSSPDLAKVAHDLTNARTAEREARMVADQAVKDARDVREKVDRIEHDLQDLDAKVKTAVDTVVAAQNDADRAGASAKLGELQREKAEMEARLAAARAAAERARRSPVLRVDPKCVDNPLAKGCS